MKKIIAIGLIGFVFWSGLYGMVFMWVPFILKENATPEEKWGLFWKHLGKMTVIGLIVSSLAVWTGIGLIATIYNAVELISNLIVYWIVVPALLIKFAKGGFRFNSNSKEDDYGMV